MMGILVGHCPRSTGYKTLALPRDEYFYNLDFCQAVVDRWGERGFMHGVMVNTPDSKSSVQSVGDRIALATKLGVKIAVEVHHNYSRRNDYGCCFYYRHNPMGKALADEIQKYLYPPMMTYGLKNWHVWDLPDHRFAGRGKEAVLKSPYTALIIEPCFMNYGPSRPYFRCNRFEHIARLLADVLIDFYESL